MVLQESEVFLTQWRNIVREMLINVLLELCMQLVHIWCSQAMCIERDSECSSSSIHPSNQTCFIYSFAGYRVQQSSSKGQVNHRESRLYWNHLWWVVECSWARNNELHHLQPSTTILQEHRDKGQQTHRSLHCRWTEGSHQWPWTTEGICTGNRQCGEHEGC